VNRRLLSIYLNDHLAGATVGAHVIRRGLKADGDHPVAPFLRRLLNEVEEDRATLVRFMEVLRVPRSAPKSAIAWAGEKVGRLKLNGRLVGRSPLSRQEELEFLILGVQGKRRLWTALSRLSPPEVIGSELDGLIARADSQLAGLEEHWDAAVREALGRRVERGPAEGDRGSEEGGAEWKR
jgi:hypothetical protein